VGDIDILDLFTECVHFLPFGPDQLLVRISFGLFCQDSPVGSFDALLKFKILFDIKGAEILGALEHHVLKQVGKTGLATVLKC